MSPLDAAKLLEVAPDATPEQIESRFLELRTKLEDKIAKSPTPGLKEKYRATLTEITTAFETLAITADSSSLPVLRRETPPTTEGGRPAPDAGGQKSEASPIRPLATAHRAPVAKRSGGREFALVAVIAVAVLGGGGWFVMKTRAENAEKERVAAEAKAAAEQKAAQEKKQAEDARLAKDAADKAEKERQDRLFTQLRTRMAELNVPYDALMRTEQAADRELSDLKSQEREQARDNKGGPTPAMRRLSAQVQAADRYTAWLHDTLPVHPAKIAKAKADELISARSVDDAAPAVEAFAAGIQKMQSDIAAAKASMAVTGSVDLTSNLTGTTWQFTDGFGIARTGTSPQKVDDVASGRASVIFRRAGWPDVTRNIEVKAGAKASVAADFPIGSARITSNPAGAAVKQGAALLGVTPLDLTQVPPGPLEVRVWQKGFKSHKLTGRVDAGRSLALSVDLAPGRATDPDSILDAIAEDTAFVTDPKARVNSLNSQLQAMRRLEGIPRQKLTSLMDAFLAATRGIVDPAERIPVLARGHNVIATLDFERSRAWAEEAVGAFVAVTKPGERNSVYHYADDFAIHPDVCARIAAAMGNWFTGSEEWVYLATVAKLQKQLGNDAEAQRLAARAAGPESLYRGDSVRGTVNDGIAARQFASVRRTLLKDGKDAARRELAAVTSRLGGGDFYQITSDFLVAEDFEALQKLAQLSEGPYVTRDAALSRVLSTVVGQGYFAVGERWAATLSDGTDAPLRSQAYRQLAESYLAKGYVAEARAAAAKIVNFAKGGSATDHLQAALLLIQLGQPERARQLAAASGMTYNKEGEFNLMYAVPYFATAGDSAAAERALATMQSISSTLYDNAVYYTVKAFGEMGRFADAESWVARAKGVVFKDTNRQILAMTQARSATEEQIDGLIDDAQPGLQRLAMLYGIMDVEIQRQLLARFPRPAL
jgi:cytoskeletal protein RodZ